MGIHDLAEIISDASAVNAYGEEHIPDTAPEFDMDFDVLNLSELEKKNPWIYDLSDLWSRQISWRCWRFVNVYKVDEGPASFAMNPAAIPAEPTGMLPELVQ